jgi:hypothetical protein
MKLSLAQKILKSQKPFVFYHTHEVTRDSLQEAIDSDKSMDLDICVDESGMPYLGHSEEFYEKSGTARDRSMPLWEAVDLISTARIPAIVDCKHYRAWPYVQEVIARIGPDKCLAHTFVSEFHFSYVRHYDVRCEWSSVEKLKALKAEFPSLTTTASAKGLPYDLLISERFEELLHAIKKTLVEHRVDTVCLNVPDNTFSDQALAFFLEDEIIPHIMIDDIDTSELSEVYIGETDALGSASTGACLRCGAKL